MCTTKIKLLLLIFSPRIPSPAESSHSPVNFPGDQENRDLHGRCPPETGAPVENSDSQGPSEASLPPLEGSPRGEGRGALSRSFPEETGPDDKSLAQPLQEEFPSQKGSGGSLYPTQEKSPGDKSNGASPLSVQGVFLPEKNEKSLAQPVQEEFRSDKDSSTLPLSLQEDSPPGKGHQSLPQPVQEEAAKDEDNGTLPLPVQDDSSLVKDHQSLVQPVQEEAPRDKDSGALLVQAQGDSSQSLEVQSGERVFQDGNHQLTEGGRLHRVPLRGGPPLPLSQTTPRNRGGGNASYHNSSENARAESPIGEAPHRTERHSRDNSASATIDLGDLDSRPNGVQDESPDDDMGGRRVCNCLSM